MVTKSEVKVGLFILFGICLVGLVVFLIGDERRLFSRSVEYRAEFQNVQGLKHGAPVQMGGVRIGHVAKVGYGTEPSDLKVYVVLRIVASEAGRILSDSRVHIDNKGLLGDKMITISKGETPPAVAPGGIIPSEEPTDIAGKVGSMAVKAEAALEKIGTAAGSLGDERLHQNLREAIASLNVLLKQITEGKGYPHRFINSAEEADRVSRAVDSIEKTATELGRTLREVRLLAQRVRTGPGFAHEVIYEQQAPRSIQQIGDAANEMSISLRKLRQSDSLAHDLLYGGEGDGVSTLANLSQIMADVRDIVSGIKQGRGTLGALLVDPSVYEDLKRILGNVERNKVLRALVRYSIKQDERKASPKR